MNKVTRCIWYIAAIAVAALYFFLIGGDIGTLIDLPVLGFMLAVQILYIFLIAGWKDFSSAFKKGCSKSHIKTLIVITWSVAMILTVCNVIAFLNGQNIALVYLGWRFLPLLYASIATLLLVPHTND